MVMFHSYVNVYQRVSPPEISSCEKRWRKTAADFRPFSGKKKWEKMLGGENVARPRKKRHVFFWAQWFWQVLVVRFFVQLYRCIMVYIYRPDFKNSIDV